MVSPVHLRGHSVLSHVHLGVNVVHAVLEVLRQAVDGTVRQGGVDGVQWCETHILQTGNAVQIL